MAALGDISRNLSGLTEAMSLALTIPVWPDVSVAIPAANSNTTSNNGTPGSVTFN